MSHGEEDPKKARKTCWDIGPEQTRHHFYNILVYVASHKASLDSKEG